MLALLGVGAALLLGGGGGDGDEDDVASGDATTTTVDVGPATTSTTAAAVTTTTEVAGYTPAIETDFVDRCVEDQEAQSTDGQLTEGQIRTFCQCSFDRIEEQIPFADFVEANDGRRARRGPAAGHRGRSCSRASTRSRAAVALAVAVSTAASCAEPPADDPAVTERIFLETCAPGAHTGRGARCAGAPSRRITAELSPRRSSASTATCATTPTPSPPRSPRPPSTAPPPR